jgi:hypothetical protein
MVGETVRRFCFGTHVDALPAREVEGNHSTDDVLGNTILVKLKLWELDSI